MVGVASRGTETSEDPVVEYNTLKLVDERMGIESVVLIILSGETTSF